MRVIFLLFLVMAAVVVVAVRMLPWWVVLALLAGLALAMPIFLRWGLTWLLKLPFRAKGLCSQRRGRRACDQRTRPRRWSLHEPGRRRTARAFSARVTITPPASGPFTLWVSELAIVGRRAGRTRDGRAQFDVRVLEIGRTASRRTRDG
jgi:hypothetical protein